MEARIALPTQEGADSSEGRIYLHPDAFLAAQISAGELLAVSCSCGLSPSLLVARLCRQATWRHLGEWWGPSQWGRSMGTQLMTDVAVQVLASQSTVLNYRFTGIIFRSE